MQLSTNLPCGEKAVRAYLANRGESRLPPNVGVTPVVETAAPTVELDPTTQAIISFLRATADRLKSKRDDIPLDQYVAAIVHRAEFLALADELDPPPTQSSVHCAACGMVGADFEAKVSGTFCNMACVETALFGTDKCRWCGSNMRERTYTSIESRLCSKQCSTSYWDHVKGDRTAVLGTGTRYRLWAQRHPKRDKQTEKQIIPMMPAGDLSALADL